MVASGSAGALPRFEHELADCLSMRLDTKVKFKRPRCNGNNVGRGHTAWSALKNFRERSPDVATKR
jgi:hypothetical protein